MVVPGTGTVNPVFMRFLAEIGGNSRGEFPLEVELTGRMQHPAGSNRTHRKHAMAEGILDTEPGVYAIHNIVNGRVYIGQTRNVSRRFKQHRRLLNMGGHSNPGLQADWKEHGEAAFKMEVMVRAPLKDCPAIEARLIEEKAGPGCYNIPWADVEWKGGRPTIAASGEAMKPRQIRMTDDEWRKCLELGGAAWVRKQIAIS